MRQRRNPGECPRCGQAMPPAPPAPPKPLSGTWGAAVRQARREFGMTLAEVADDTGLSRSWISRLERGDEPPGLEAERALCEYLGVPPRVEFRVFFAAPLSDPSHALHRHETVGSRPGVLADTLLTLLLPLLLASLAGCDARRAR